MAAQSQQYGAAARTIDRDARVRQLMEMGFTHARVTAALNETGGSVEHAVASLLSEEVSGLSLLDFEAQVEEKQQPRREHGAGRARRDAGHAGAVPHASHAVHGGAAPEPSAAKPSARADYSRSRAHMKRRGKKAHGTEACHMYPESMLLDLQRESTGDFDPRSRKAERTAVWAGSKANLTVQEAKHNRRHSGYEREIRASVKDPHRHVGPGAKGRAQQMARAVERGLDSGQLQRPEAVAILGKQLSRVTGPRGGKSVIKDHLEKGVRSKTYAVRDAYASAGHGTPTRVRKTQKDGSVDQRSAAVRDGSLLLGKGGKPDRRSAAVRQGDVRVKGDGTVDGRSSAARPRLASPPASAPPPSTVRLTASGGVDGRSSAVQSGSLKFKSDGTVDRRCAAVRSGAVRVTQSGHVDGRSSAVRAAKSAGGAGSRRRSGK